MPFLCYFNAYGALPAEADWTVTPDMDETQADRILRAFYGYECVYQDGAEKTELIRGRVIPGDPVGQPFPVQGGYITADQVKTLS